MEDDDALAELIIRNIVDLEHSLMFLEDEIKPRLAEAIFDIIEEGAGFGDWYIDDRTDPGGWFCPEEWRIGPENKPNAAIWFQIETPEDEPWKTWAGRFAGGSNTATTAACMVRYNWLGKRQWQEIRNSLPDEMAKIRSAGFVVDGDRIYFSLPLDRESLAQAFKEGDPRQALGRIQSLSEALDIAMPAFRSLHAAQAKVIAGE